MTNIQKLHNGTLAHTGMWADAVTGERRYRYVAISDHPGEDEPVNTYTRSAAEFILWAIDERVRGEAFRNAVGG